MKSSFIKSLPSHRRKEKERKQRQQRQRRSHGGTSYEGGDFGRLAGGANPSDSNPVPDGIHSNKITAEKIKPLTTFSSSARLESEYKSTMNDLSFKNYDEKGVYTQNESPAKKLRTNATCHSNIDDHDREHNDFVSSPVSQTLLEDKAPTESESNHKAEMPRTKPNVFFSPGLPEGSSGMIIDRNQLISNNCNGKGQTNSLSLIVCAGAHCQPKSKYGTSDEVGNDLNDDDDSVVEGTELLTSCLPISGGAFTQDKYHSLISNRRRHNSLKGDTAIDHETQFVTIKQFVSSLAQDRIHSTSYGPVGTISAPNLTREKVTNNSVVQSSIKSEEDEESAATNNENTKPQTFRTPWTSKHRSKDSTVMSKNQEVDLLNLQFIPPINRDGIVMDNAATNESRHTIIRAGFNDNDKASERTTQDSSTTFRCASKTSSQKELTEFILSSTDLADIIEAVKETIAMGKSEESDDFIDTDLENLLSSLESFHNYLLDISIPSTEEARDLETKSDGNDKVFAIFRYGLNMDHCNVIFYLDAMKDVCNRMIQVGVHSQTNNKHISKTRKLDRFSSLVRWIFGVDIVDDSKRISSFTVNVTKEAGNQTSLLFQAKPLETCNISSGEKGINLPEHLVVISRLFDDFAAQRRQKIQYQLDMTMQNLSSIRRGAFELQRLAVQLRDQIAEAKNEAQEAKAECGRLQDTIMRQKHEFQRREESFERLKEHYEAEIIKKEQEIARVNNQHEQRFKRTKEVESATLRLRKEETPSEIDANLKNINDGPRHSPSLSRNSLCEPLSVRRRGTETNEKISMLERHLPQPSPVTSAKDDEVQEREQCKGLHTATHPSTFSLRRDAASLPRTVEEKNHSVGAYEITSNRQAGKPCRDPLKQLSVNILSTRLHDSRKVQTEKKAKNSKTRPVHDANYNPPERGNAKEECAVIKEQVPQSNSDTNVSSDEYPTNTKRIIDNSNREFSNTTTPQETKHHSKTSEESNLGSYKYKEVVRGHDRRALPGRECEHCRLFHDAMCAQNCGDYFDREKIVNECSRHRSRYEQDLTPPDFWEMSFADSIANRKRSDENISPVSD